jgi:hypothetical protein
MLKQIQEIKLGSIVYAGFYDGHFRSYKQHLNHLQVCVIGRYTNTDERCVAWNGDSCDLQKIVNGKGKWFKSFFRYEMHPSYSEFEFYKWVNPDLLVLPFDQVEEILFPDQKCIGCNLPAPHAAPNMSGNKFQCITCKLINEIQ